MVKRLGAFQAILNQAQPGSLSLTDTDRKTLTPKRPSMPDPIRPIRLLHLEDNPQDAQLIHDLLAAGGIACNILLVDSREQFEAALNEGSFELILCDYNLPGYDGLAALEQVGKRCPDTPVIVVSGSINEEEAVRCLHLGATDYLLKERLERLVSAVKRALKEAADNNRRRANEMLLRIAGTISRLGGWAVNLPPHHVEWSDEVCAIHEVPTGTFPKLEDALAFFTPEFRSIIEEAFTNCSRMGIPYDLELQITTARGRRLWVRAIGEAVREAQGTITRVQGAFQDITDRKRAEESLRRSQERYALAAHASEAGLWDWDLTTDVIEYAPHFREMLGYSVEEFPDTYAAFESCLHPDDRAATQQAIQDHIKARRSRPSNAEFRLRTKSGDYRWFLASAQAVWDESGRATRMVGSTVDITGRKLAEVRLREHAALLEKAPNAIVVCELDHRITYWNRGAERLYGWTAAEAVGSSMRKLLHPDPGLFDPAMKHLLKQGEWIGELTQVNKHGSILTIDGRWTLLRDEAGNPQAVLAINTDITERRVIETQLLRSQRMESIGTLAGGIAHDLNNLLVPIVMGVDLLRQSAPDELSQRVIRSIAQSARRGTGLVKQVLTFSRGAAGARVAVHLGHVIKEVVNIMTNSFPKNITVTTNVPEPLRLVHGDPTQLSQVLLNLCVNSRDAMPEGGRLTITTRNTDIDRQYASMHHGVSTGHYAVLEVADSGKGIAKENLERIFDPFYTTKEEGQGTGLGLYTTLGIVRSHGGFLTVKSEPGEGTTFTIHLPEQILGGDESGSAGRSSHPFVELARGHGECILLVDDESTILTITQQTLELAGYSVLTAEDGAQAISLYALHREKISVVLTDMVMPVMDGAKLIGALRRIDPQVRIIAMSGVDVPDRKARDAAAGIRHFLAKPYTSETLLTMLRDVMAGNGRQPDGAGPSP